jgi:LysR family transcriptional regulator, hydrogen peroxide-inducible genes activator
MNLRDLQYLVAVADHRHFGDAAAACFVSQPTLSTQIKKLEVELGVPLIERNPRNIVLTGPGEVIVAQAREILRQVEDIQATAQAARNPEAGSLRLGVFPTLAPYLLPHVVPGLHARYPDLELLLTEEKTDTLHERLREGRLDAVILARPIVDDQLHEDPLFAEDFVLAAPAGHPLAGGLAPVELAALADQELLLLDDGHCLRDQALAVCHLARASERAGFRATSLETLRQMVSAGVGITLLPRLAVEPPITPSPNLAIVPFAEPIPRREIALYWRRTSPYEGFFPVLAGTLRELMDAVAVPGVCSLAPR